MDFIWISSDVGVRFQHIEPEAEHAEEAIAYRRKHSGSKRRVWRKTHIAVDEKTLEILTLEVTFSAISDALLLPDLLDQIAP